MSVDDVLFVYEKRVLPNDKKFVSSFSLPKKLNSSSLDSFIDDLYKLDSIKKNISSFDKTNSSELFSLQSEIYGVESDIRNYIDSSISQLSSISSKNEASKNIALLPYFRNASKIISYDSLGVKSLEKEALSNASKFLSSSRYSSTCYFAGDSVVVDKEEIYEEHVHKKRSLITKQDRMNLFKVYAMVSAFALISFVAIYETPKFQELKSDVIEFFQSKEKNHYDAKPVAEYENQNISK